MTPVFFIFAIALAFIIAYTMGVPPPNTCYGGYQFVAGTYQAAPVQILNEKGEGIKCQMNIQ